MLNKIIVLGRMVNDPELKRTQTGTAVASFRIACDRDYSASGDKETDFLDIVAWKQNAEFVSKYFGKGRMILISGRLQIRPWTDRDGNKRTSAEIVADHFDFADSKRTDPGKGYDDSGAAPEPEFGMIDDADEQLPF